MQNKLVGTFLIAALGTAVAVASPASAQPHRSGAHAHHGGMHAHHGGMRAHHRMGAGAQAAGRASTAARGAFARGGGRHWAGRGGRHFGHRGHFGGGFGVGLALGALAAPSYYDYGPYGYDEPYYAAAPEYYDDSGRSVEYCIQHFKSYDLSTRTYLGYDGNRHRCP